jgi:hypothetical protein
MNNINPHSIGSGVKVEKTGAAGQASGIGNSNAINALDNLLGGAGEGTVSGQLTKAVIGAVSELVK